MPDEGRVAAPSPDLPVTETATTSPAESLRVAGKVAVAAALATTLAAGPVAPERIVLPDPVPIVCTIDMGADQPASSLDANQAADHRAFIKQIIKKALWVLLALFLLTALVLGTVKTCTGQAAMPNAEERECDTRSE